MISVGQKIKNNRPFSGAGSNKVMPTPIDGSLDDSKNMLMEAEIAETTNQFRKQKIILQKQRTVFDSSDDEEIKKKMNDVFFQSSLNVGSVFVSCSTDKVKLQTEDSDDLMPIEFYRDNRGKLVGSFYIRNTTSAESGSFLAYYVYSSSQIPFRIAPASGFVRPGSMDQIGVQWPDSDVDDNGNLIKYDLDYLSQAMFFVKALPVSPAYMEEMLPHIDLDQICTEIFQTDLLELIYNKYNV